MFTGHHCTCIVLRTCVLIALFRIIFVCYPIFIANLFSPMYIFLHYPNLLQLHFIIHSVQKLCYIHFNDFFVVFITKIY